MTQPSRYRAATESSWAGIPSWTGIHDFVLAHEVQREGNARENQQQINQRIRGQMKGVVEDPGQQQNHSDDYEHWSFQSLLSSQPQHAHRANNSSWTRHVQGVAELQEKFSVELPRPLARYRYVPRRNIAKP